jgi:hypothetical protein
MLALVGLLLFLVLAGCILWVLSGLIWNDRNFR